MRVHTGLSGRGEGDRLLFPEDWGTQNNSPGTQFPSHQLQATDGPRKKQKSETDQERLSFPRFIPVVFFFSLSLPAPFPQQSALATKRHLQSIMINSLHLSHLFSPKNHSAAWVKATAASSWNTSCIILTRQLKFAKAFLECSCLFIPANLFKDWYDFNLTMHLFYYTSGFSSGNNSCEEAKASDRAFDLDITTQELLINSDEILEDSSCWPRQEK